MFLIAAVEKTLDFLGNEVIPEAQNKIVPVSPGATCGPHFFKSGS